MFNQMMGLDEQSPRVPVFSHRKTEELTESIGAVQPSTFLKSVET
jgi:hypothetical protein